MTTLPVHSNPTPYRFPPLPRTSQDRLDASLVEQCLDANTLTKSELSAAEEKGKTVLYLAYGSNLCNETFRGARGIRPLSQINVLVPELRLTFDLPGLPYVEPCFANSARRDAGDATSDKADSSGYHKDRWHKGLVGCVYEVTPTDYATIIATEGGGSSYKDILVTCYPLPEAETVPEAPSTPAFKAHTLFAPAVQMAEATCLRDRIARPDPSYAQPSARYLKLITDGARELCLPVEYQEYLADIRPYTITTKRQTAGKMFFAATWVPFVMLVMTLHKKLQDEKGRSPGWLATLTGWIFMAMWMYYDVVYKPVFGDGERTVGDAEEDTVARRRRLDGSKNRWAKVEAMEEEVHLL